MVVYFCVDDAKDAVVKLCELLKYRRQTAEVYSSNWNQVLIDSHELHKVSWNELRSALTSAGKMFKAKYGFVPTLVIDNSNLIATYHRNLLLEMQNLAKTGADHNFLKIFFVSSDASTLTVLRSSSAVSRGSVVQVQDITDDQAIQYLVSSGVPVERANYAVKNITGGRFSELLNYLDQFSSMSDEKILFGKFLQLGIHVSSQKLACNHTLFQEIRDNSLRMETREIVSAEVLNRLVSMNVLKNLDSELSFHGRAVELFFEMAFSNEQFALRYCVRGY